MSSLLLAMSRSLPLVLLPALPSLLLAQESNSSANSTAPAPATAPALRIAEPPVIDGRLDDVSWSEPQPFSGFIQRIPRDGQPTTQPTEVWVGYDDAALYVAVRAHDDAPSLIVPGEGIRDYDLTLSDAVLLVFDTYNDGENGFVFGTNPAGIQYDGQVVDQGGGGREGLIGGSLGRGGAGSGRQQGGSGGGFNLNWDGNWQVATSSDAGGWSAEFRIPFSTLRYGAGVPQDWGFNVARRIRRVTEESFWSPISREFNLYRVSEAGTLTGLEPPTSRSVQAIPYVLASTARDYESGQLSFDEQSETGIDAKIQVTQGMTLDLTYNTDFAQVEVDDVQTNLTRFNLSFPEKRPFFLENAGMFAVGGRGVNLFFSRSIGIANHTRVPIKGGARLSGKIAGLNVGALHIRTEEVDGVQPPTAFSVARVYKELGNRSTIGGIFLERNGIESECDYNRTYALDGQVGIGTAINFSGLVARTETPGRDGRDHMFNVEGRYQRRSLRLDGGYRQVGEAFNPEVGFLQRPAGYWNANAMWMVYFRPESFLGVREFRPHMRYNTTRNLETGFEESSELHIDSHIEWHSGMFFSPALNWVSEGLEEPFPIHEGITVPPGTYDGWDTSLLFYTNQAAPISFETRLDWGSFLSGTRRTQPVIVQLRHGSSFSTALRFEYNDVDLAEGSFIYRLAGLRLGYFFTPDIYLQSLIQYSDQADNWSANIRFGWLGPAGTGLFIVYNQAHGLGAIEGPLNRALIIKFSRLFNVLGG